MKRYLIPVGIAALFVAGCVKQSTYDASQAQLADTQKQLAATTQQLTDAQQQVATLQAQLATDQGKLAHAMRVPVSVRFRRAMAGPGYVAIFQTTTKSELPIAVEIESRALGTKHSYDVFLPAMGVKEIGHGEGTPLEDGDKITISSGGFESVTTTFHPRQ